MSSKKNLTNFQGELDNILNFNDDEDKLEFEESVINSDYMGFIEDLMNKNIEKKMMRKELALKLGVSEAYVSQLFSGDKKINIRLMAQFQRIFNFRFRPAAKRRRSKHGGSDYKNWRNDAPY